MTNNRAINLLFGTWWGFSVILLLIVGIQSLNGKYGDDWAIPSQWAVAMVAPCLALVSAAWRNKGKARWQNSPVPMQHFVVAMIFSALVWFGTLAIIVFAALGHLRMFDIIPMTVALYSLIQSVVIGSISSIAFANR